MKIGSVVKAWKQNKHTNLNKYIFPVFLNHGIDYESYSSRNFQRILPKKVQFKGRLKMSNLIARVIKPVALPL